MADAAAPSRFIANDAVCIACGTSHALAADLYGCGCPARENLAVRYGMGPERRAALLESAAGNARSLWRYAPLLPVAARFGTPLGVGWTPLHDFGDVAGRHFLVKDETRNPSLSLKDRASEIAIAVARAHGIAEMIVASTGNAAASLACLGAACGIAVTVLVPKSAPDAKLAQIVAHGARVFRVDGSYDDAYALARKVSEAKGLLNRSTGLNPFTREGKKTCAFEIAEQLGWRAPDWVIVPTGDGNILSAIWKGFRELAALGLLDRLPRLVAAQSIASNAIGRGFDPGQGVADPSLRTIADSITVDAPRDRAAALAALRESDGFAVSVDDGEIVAAVRALASRFGVLVEPSSAAGYAAFERLLGAGIIAAGRRVVLLATGSGLKDLRPVLDPALLDAVRVIGRDAWQAV